MTWRTLRCIQRNLWRWWKVWRWVSLCVVSEVIIYYCVILYYIIVLYYYIILYYIILYYIILYTSPCLMNLIWILNSKIWIDFNMQKLIYKLSWRGQFKQTPCMCINSRYTSSTKDANPETMQCLQEMKPQTFAVCSEGETAQWQNITFCCMSHLLISLTIFSSLHFVSYLIHCTRMCIFWSQYTAVLMIVDDIVHKNCELRLRRKVCCMCTGLSVC